MEMITTEEELEEIVKRSPQSLLVIKLFADWCGPCKRVTPEYVKISGEYDGVLFAKVNVDEVESAADDYEITGMPTFLFFKGGELIDRVVGGNVDLLRSTIVKHK